MYLTGYSPSFWVQYHLQSFVSITCLHAQFTHLIDVGYLLSARPIHSSYTPVKLACSCICYLCNMWYMQFIRKYGFMKYNMFNMSIHVNCNLYMCNNSVLYNVDVVMLHIFCNACIKDVMQYNYIFKKKIKYFF